MPLTNEQLFDIIKDGNEDLKPVLWERVKNLAYMLSSRFYAKNMELCRSRGLEEWDIKQLSYLAYASLFEKYSTDKDYTLSTALGYALKVECKKALGSAHDTLNSAISLDECLNDETDTERIEVIADDQSTEKLEKVEKSAENEYFRKTIDKALESCRELERYAVKRHYYDNKPLTQVAEEYGVSRQAAYAAHDKALQKLYRKTEIRRLWDDLGYSSYRIYKNQVEYIAAKRADLEAEQQRIYEKWERELELEFDEEHIKEENKKRDEKLARILWERDGFDYMAFMSAYKEDPERAKANVKSFYIERAEEQVTAVE